MHHERSTAVIIPPSLTFRLEFQEAALPVETRDPNLRSIKRLFEGGRWDVPSKAGDHTRADPKTA